MNQFDDVVLQNPGAFSGSRSSVNYDEYSGPGVSYNLASRSPSYQGMKYNLDSDTLKQYEPPMTSQLSASKAGKFATGIVTDLSQAKANVGVNEYLSDLEEWKAQGKYWFDPNSNLEPDLEAYMDSMPSTTEALTKGTMTGGKVPSGAGRGIMGAFTLGTSEIGNNPARSEYVLNKSGERALQGLSTAGPWGALGGGIIGIVEGFFTWGSAESKDKKDRAKAMLEYNRKLEEWQAAKKKRNEQLNMQYNTMMYENSLLKEKESENKTSAKKANVENKKINAYNAMIQALSNAGTASSAAKSRRMGAR